MLAKQTIFFFSYIMPDSLVKIVAGNNLYPLGVSVLLKQVLPL